ncbi:MAG TPA: hypothetical protein VFF07_16235, partial [Actinomycetota bacterium]|nr:hypothetical protein [Actinomycetota bacterium]
ARVGGVGAALLVMLVVGGYALRRRQQGSPAPARPEPMSRDEIVRRIAELDLEFHAGELERERWQEERVRLKARLAEVAEPVP